MTQTITLPIEGTFAETTVPDTINLAERASGGARDHRIH